ncbi:unnamed protein product, partial [marine sediment metagenome]
YGFAGADEKSMDTLHEALQFDTYNHGRYRGCISLPLTISYRCSQAVAKEAQSIVPEFTSHLVNPEGSVTRGSLDNPQPGDMVLCRVNASLISQAFKLISSGIPSKIIGKDIKSSILNLIDSLNPDSVMDLVRKIEKQKESEVAYLEKQKPVPYAAVLAVRDKYNCLLSICREATSISCAQHMIHSLFSDDDKVDCVRLSSIHRAKGLEADNVYVIRPDLLPHPLAKSDWQVEQEMNLKYVAITRARNNLIWVEE